MPETFIFVGNPEIGNELAPNLLEAGFRAADGLKSADVVFTFTPFIEDTEEVYFGSQGMISQAKEGAYLVNLGTASQSLTHEIFALAQVSSMCALDAPLFVHDAARDRAFADRSNLSMFVGAEEGDYAAVQQMLASLCDDIIVCGGPGTGQLAKAAASLQRSAAVVGLIEADALCRVAEGAEAASSVIARTLAACCASPDVVTFYTAVASRRFSSSYTADVMLGEVVSALSSADDVELILPQAETAEYLLQLLMTVGGEGKGVSALSLLYADEPECARNGLDWSRAEEFYGSAAFGYDGYDDYEDYGGYDDDDDHGPGDGHGHSHGHGFGFN